MSIFDKYFAGDEEEDPNPYLLPAFYFRVYLGGRFGFLSNSSPSDHSFLEVSGLTAEMQTESVVEGGENRYVHQLPSGVKYPKLQLKRGIVTLDSPLAKWCKKTLEGGFASRIEPLDLSVRLLDRTGDPVRVWEVVHAYPVKWEVESFNSTKNEVAIEKIELNYNFAHRTK
ncbi:MAG: phage tail-like protein [Pseudohongiellaceae bacterium]|jgi:phage tail-like protein